MDQRNFRELSQHLDQLESMAAVFAAQIALVRQRLESVGESDGATSQIPLPMQPPHHEPDHQE